MRRHFLSMLQHTAVCEIGGDPGCPKAVIAYARMDAGREGIGEGDDQRSVPQIGTVWVRE